MTSSQRDEELQEWLEANSETIETDDGEYLAIDIEKLTPYILLDRQQADTLVRIAESREIIENISPLGAEVYFAVERIREHIKLLERGIENE